MSGRLTRAPARIATEQDALGWLSWRFGDGVAAGHRSLEDQVETYLAGATDLRVRAILNGDQSVLTVDVLRRYADGTGPLTTSDARRACEVVAALADRVAAAETFLGDVEALIGSSGGVAGLHLNGDVAPWDTLLAGGQFEPWLRSLDDLRDLIGQTPAKAGALDSRTGHENEDLRQTMTAEELARNAELQARSMGYEPDGVAASLDRVSTRLFGGDVTPSKEPLPADQAVFEIASWPPALPTYDADQAKTAAGIVSRWAGGPGGTAQHRCLPIGKIVELVGEALGVVPAAVEDTKDAARFAAIKPC